MPSSVERALADALSLEHPDVAWTPPPRLPSAQDLRTALTVLQPPPAGEQHIAWCLAKLALAFETASARLSPEATKLRVELWREANGDLGDELWSKATMAAIRGLKWMPKPAEFRDLVAADLVERGKKLGRCRGMLSAIERATAAPVETPTASRLERLRFSRGMFERMGRPIDVARMDREIAKEEGRPAETAIVSRETQPAERPPFVPSTSPGASALRGGELGAAHHAGKLESNRHEWDDATEHRDIAEAS